jgi:outer membrane protein OmpU
MKKVLLAGTALLGLAALASPAQAEVKLDLGGFFRGYAIFADNDESAADGAASLREFDFRRHTEIHFSGETTTDNGLTIGVHDELELGNETATTAVLSETNEAYMYVSGGWGRANFGSEDGAAYLLQVAAPSADSNVDGMRVYMQALNSDLWDDGDDTGTSAGIVLDYDHADSATRTA